MLAGVNAYIMYLANLPHACWNYPEKSMFAFCCLENITVQVQQLSFQQE